MVRVDIPNRLPEEMRKEVEALPFLAYHVETLADGRKVCITKPGGKSFWGRMVVNDFMVWIYDEEKRDRWRVSHKEIKEDVRLKLGADFRRGSEFVDLMGRVCEGKEPSNLGTAAGGR
jgi:hypothetical protein